MFNKNKKFDFVISEYTCKNTVTRRILRFYPNSSYYYCRFDQQPRSYKGWSNELFKIYYSWAIIEQHFEKVKIKLNLKSENVLFYMGQDVNCQIPYISLLIKNEIDNCDMSYDTRVLIDNISFFDSDKTQDKLEEICDTGDWKVTAYTGCLHDGSIYNKHCKYFKFQVLTRRTKENYKFVINSEKRALQFYKFMNNFNDYIFKYHWKIYSDEPVVQREMILRGDKDDT